MKVENGNVFDSFLEENIIVVHGCNAQGVMGSGVARYVRDNFPKAYYDYVRKHDEHGLKLGSVIFSEVLPKRIIANAITQEFFGNNGKRYVDYDAVRKCFKSVYTFALEHGISQIAFPKIGAGLGGGDWEIIEQIIKEELKDLEMTLFIP